MDNARVVGRITPEEIEARTRASREAALEAAREAREERPAECLQDVARAILEDAIEVQLALGGRLMELSPGCPDRKALYERLHRVQRAARGLLAPVPVGGPARQIIDGYRGDIAAHLNTIEAMITGQEVDDDDQLRVIGLAAENLANRITCYLSVRAVCGG